MHKILVHAQDSCACTRLLYNASLFLLHHTPMTIYGSGNRMEQNVYTSSINHYVCLCQHNDLYFKICVLP